MEQQPPTQPQDDDIQDVTEEVYGEPVRPETPEEHAERIRMLQASIPKKEKKKWPKVLFSTIVVLAVIAGGTAFAFWYGNHQAAKNSTSQKVVTVPKTTSATDAVASLKDFNSMNFGVNFKYPEDWKVVDGEQQIIATSPEVSLMSTSGQTIPGQVTISFSQKGFNTLPNFTSDNAAAVLDSEKITYSQPSNQQRAETYLSFVQYTPSATDQLDAIYITGDNGYTKDQLIPKSDIINNDPLIEVTFLKCSDKTCAYTTKTSLDPTVWSKNKLFKDSIEAILKSLSLS